LFVRDSVAPFCAWARREALNGDFFDRVLSVAAGVACDATSGDRRSTALKILATAASVREFLYRLQVIKGRHAGEAVPGIDQAGRGPFRREFRQLLRA
jgi:hypothetical protein